MGYDKPKLADGASEEQVLKHMKNIEIFNLSEKVNKEDDIAVRNFRKAASEIAKCADEKALDELVKKEKQSPFESFYVTNQDVSGVKKAEKATEDVDSDDDYVIGVNKMLDERKKKADK